MVRIIIIVCIIVAVVGGVWWWHNYHSGAVYDGSVVRREAAMETGTTTMENGQNLGEAHPTPSRSDTPGTINGDPYHPDRADLDTQTTPITRNPYATPYTDETLQPQPNSPKARVRYDDRTPPYRGPVTDSQPPNAPNGLPFTGSGSYQWYRQGDITYRVDTRTGSSCIIYATMEEWRKPDVYRHGCRVY